MAHNRIISIPASGRSYDIDFVNWTDQVTGEAQFSFGELSKKTTGIVKVVNKFIKILLTRVGSDPFNREIGTLFEDLQYRGGDSDAALGTFATEQIKNAFSQMKIIQGNNSFPADENIISVTLRDINRPSQDQISFSLRIITEAGEQADIIVPIIGG